MRKVLIWILPLFALAWSCAKDDAGTAERAKARLTLNILEEGPRLAARAADEKAVQDVNVFLYDVRGIARPQHFYVQGGVLACGFADVAWPHDTVAHLLQCGGHGCELGVGGGHSFCRRSRALSKVSSFLAKQNRTTRWSNPSP